MEEKEKMPWGREELCRIALESGLLLVESRQSSGLQERSRCCSVMIYLYLAIVHTSLHKRVEWAL